jgi:hypothetical protein
MAQGSIVAIVGGIQYEEPSATYKRVILKSNLPFASQVTESNRLYVIKWDFDLGGETVNIPSNCILQFEGGVLRNGTVSLNNTRIWPCYDALKLGNVLVSGKPADGTIGYIGGNIKWSNYQGWNVVGEQEIFFKEYECLEYDGDFDGLESPNYYRVQVKDMLDTLDLYGHLTIKYGYSSFAVYVNNTEDLDTAHEAQEFGFANNEVSTPHTFTANEITTLEHDYSETDYIFFVENRSSNALPRDLRIVY